MDVPPPHPLSWIRYHRWIFPASLLGALGLVALFAPLIAPQNPWDLAELQLEDGYLAPPWTERGQTERIVDGELDTRFFLGTDAQGRDIFSAVLYGLRVSLMVGLIAATIAMVIGVGLGLISGYLGGRVDALIMRVADVQLAFPSVLIALFLMAVWGQGLWKIILAVAIVHWVVYARMLRGLVLSERERDYISAIRALGGRLPRILFRHLLPNLTGPILVVSAVEFASVVILEATLSYLGLGVPITRPSLGMLIKFGYDDFFSGDWWVWFFPGVALVLLIVSINWLADVLRTIIAVRA